MLSQNLVLSGLAGLLAGAALTLLSVFLTRRRPQADLRRNQEKLHQLTLENKQLRELSEVLRRTLSHDLGNPLMALRLYLDLLAGGKIKEEDRLQTLGKMSANVTAAKKLLERARSLGLAQREASAMTPEVVPVTELLKEIASQGRSVFGPKDLRLEVKDHVPVGVHVHCSRRALFERILPTALSNAAKYSFRGGVVKVEVRVHDSGHSVVVQVIDSGVGISAEEFDRQLSSPRPGTEEESGDGMGLILMGLFLRKFGGDYQLTSPGTGGGSTLKLELRRVIGTDERLSG